MPARYGSILEPSRAEKEQDERDPGKKCTWEDG